jgi:hypothetical protein
MHYNFTANFSLTGVLKLGFYSVLNHVNGIQFIETNAITVLTSTFVSKTKLEADNS